MRILLFGSEEFISFHHPLLIIVGRIFLSIELTKLYFPHNINTHWLQLILNHLGNHVHTSFFS